MITLLIICQLSVAQPTVPPPSETQVEVTRMYGLPGRRVILSVPQFEEDYTDYNLFGDQFFANPADFKRKVAKFKRRPVYNRRGYRSSMNHE